MRRLAQHGLELWSRTVHVEDGFTLVELLVAMAVSAIVLAGAVLGLTNAFEQSSEVSGRVAATAQAEVQLAALTRDLRDAVPCGTLQSYDIEATSGPTITLCDPVSGYLSGSASPTSYVPTPGLVKWSCNTAATVETCTRYVNSGGNYTETSAIHGVTSLTLTDLAGNPAASGLLSGNYMLSTDTASQAASGATGLVSWVGINATVAQLEYPNSSTNFTQVPGTSPFTISTGVELRNYGT